MRQLEAVRLERFNDTEIDRPVKFSVETEDGRILDYDSVIGEVPAVTSAYDGIHRPQTVIADSAELPLWDEDKHFPVGRIAGWHGRNLEVRPARVKIEDEHGNIYSSLCIKGSNFSDPHFFETGTAARGHIIYGLQESLVMERIIRSSSVLRQNNIRAEYICGMAMPETFPLRDSGELGIDSVQKKSLSGLLEVLATRHAKENPTEDKSFLEVKAEMIDKFSDCNYLVTYRAMDMPYRARDIGDPEKYQELLRFIGENFEFEDERHKEGFMSLDQRTYLIGIFAPQIAQNIVRMHSIGLVHGFLTSGNVSAYGGLVDLDSCKGEPLGLGDEPVTSEQRVDELVYVSKTICEIADMLHENQNDVRVTAEDSLRILLGEYINEMDYDEEQRTAMIADSLLAAAKDNDIDNEMLASIAKGLTYSWSYTNSERPDFGKACLPPNECFDDERMYEDYPYLDLPPRFMNGEKTEILAALRQTSNDIERNFTYSNFIIGLSKVELRSFIMAHSVDDKIADPEQLVRNMQYYVGVKIINEEEAKSQSIVHDSMHARIESLLERLESFGADKMSKPVKEFLAGIEEFSFDQVGYLTKSEYDGEEETKKYLPLVYADSDAQYLDILQRLSTRPETISHKEYKAHERGIDFSDSLLVVDHGKIEGAQLYHFDANEREVFREVFLVGDFIPDSRPTLLIEGISSGKPKARTIVHSDRSNGMFYDAKLGSRCIDWERVDQASDETAESTNKYVFPKDQSASS
jgi:hypothetical protein